MRKENIQSWVRSLTIFLTVVLLVFATVKMTYESDRQPYFIDETSDTLAALNFLTTGDYTSVFFNGGRKFGPGLSVGIASSWPAGTVWALGGNLFQSRLALGLIAFLQFLLGSYLVFRPRNWTTFLFGVSLGWMVLLQTPYWYGFLLNVGELTGALFLLCGWGVLRTKPALAFFLWGVAVWSCKFIYVPTVFAWGVVWAFSSKDYWRRLGLGVGWFFVPLLLWMAAIVIRYDLSSMMTWFKQFISFVIHGGSGLDEVASGLQARLQSSVLEWSSYTLGWKARILGILFAPLFGLVLFWKSLNSKAFFVASTAAVLFYASWYFLWSPMMLIRHIQPGMYVALGVFFAMVWESEIWKRTVVKKIALALLMVVLIREGMTFSTRFPLLVPHIESYPRNCHTDLTRQPCVPPDKEAELYPGGF